mgnify:CR=1 FL=1
MAGIEAVVCVPARDEEERLPRLCRALARQVTLDGQPFDTGAIALVLVLNNCRDGSLDAARRAASMHRRLRVEVVEAELDAEAAHVGTARRIAMDTGAEILRRHGKAGAALLTTDADAVPARNWVAANLAAIGAGADLVGGVLGHLPDEARIMPEAVVRTGRLLRSYRAAIDRLEAVLDPLPYDPVPRHWDHTGASLAISAEAYRGVGGLPPLRCREDLALVAAVRRAGGRLRHCPAVRVMVSTRLVGRAAGGMADTLNGWARAATEGTPILVQDPASAESLFRARAAIRTLFHAARPAGPDAVAQVARRTDVAPDALTAALAAAGSAGALVEALLPDTPDAPATVPLDGALRSLQARLRLSAPDVPEGIVLR